jgi:cell division protein FtsI/penicillin-binding protein 2
MVRRPNRHKFQTRKRLFYKKPSPRLLGMFSFLEKSQKITNKYRHSGVKKINNFYGKKPNTKVEYESINFFQKLWTIPKLIFTLLLAPLILTFNYNIKRFKIELDSINIFGSVFSILFLIVVLKFADLQVLSNSEIFKGSRKSTTSYTQVIPSTRGQILIQDYSKGSQIQITNTQSLSNVFIQPSALINYLEKNDLDTEDISQKVSGALNIPYAETLNFIKAEIDSGKPKNYAVLKKYINNEQKNAVNYLQYPNLEIPDNQELLPEYKTWLGFEDQEIRTYPEKSLLSTTLGFVPKHKENRETTTKSGCAGLVSKNEERGTVDTFIPGDYSKGQYTIGNYGIEQKYCEILAGLNGKKVFNNQAGTETENNSEVKNGDNIELTIDINIQRKAEEVLKEAFKKNTNKIGAPKHGSAIVMEVKTGKILAMTSFPDYDPNEYNRVEDGDVFRNASTSIDYEVGSVIKPLTVASAINEWQLNSIDNSGKRTGIDPDWVFTDYDEKGKPYEEINGNILYIQNAEGYSYQKDGAQSVSNILRDSINTGIATIVPTIGNIKLRDYYLDTFKLDKKTLVNLPGDVHGDARPLNNANNLDSKFIYATFAFGQGYTMSPIQLARAYTPLANNGYLVEPYLVERIKNQYGEVVDDGLGNDSIIPKSKPVKVLEESTARLVTGYLANTIDQGYRGVTPSKGQVDSYIVSGKTGTAQVGRETKNCKDGNRYECNTRSGIYDHTFIGYGPEKNPEYLVLMKLSEPNPGVIKNYAENSLGASWSELMKFTLEYNGVPKDR